MRLQGQASLRCRTPSLRRPPGRASRLGTGRVRRRLARRRPVRQAPASRRARSSPSPASASGGLRSTVDSLRSRRSSGPWMSSPTRPGPFTSATSVIGYGASARTAPSPPSPGPANRGSRAMGDRPRPQSSTDRAGSCWVSTDRCSSPTTETPGSDGSTPRGSSRPSSVREASAPMATAAQRSRPRSRHPNSRSEPTARSTSTTRTVSGP